MNTLCLISRQEAIHSSGHGVLKQFIQGVRLMACAWLPAMAEV
jgi:hypothetical protein